MADDFGRSNNSLSKGVGTVLLNVPCEMGYSMNGDPNAPSCTKCLPGKPTAKMTANVSEGMSQYCVDLSQEQFEVSVCMQKLNVLLFSNQIDPM